MNFSTENTPYTLSGLMLLSGLILLSGLTLILPGNAFAQKPVNVHVSILPLKYFVEKVGRDHVKVDVLLKPGKNPSTYSPSPGQIKKLASSDIYFRVGVPFENGILHKIVSVESIKIVDTRMDVPMRDMAWTHEDRNNPAGKNKPDIKNTSKTNDTNSEHIKENDSLESHGHEGKDPHIWLDPKNAKIIARTIFTALADTDPENLNDYTINYESFIKELERLDERLRTALKDLKGENLFVFHPSFGYFTDAYGLHQIAIETMGKSPKGKELFKIIKLARKQKTRVIFVQPQFDRNTAQKIAVALNGAVVSIDPLAYDYMGNMENIARTIIKTFKK
jgi:zinc transport system substrate-binding protein